MKRTKKIMSLILSVVMLMAFSTSVLAAEPEVLPDDREYLVVNGLILYELEKIMKIRKQVSMLDGIKMREG